MFNFANRALPFNQLGKDITGCTTVEDCLRTADLDWIVESKPLYNEKGNIIPGYKANTRVDNDAVLGIVGNRYRVVQNVDAFSFTEELLGSGVTYEMAGVFQHGAAMWLLAKLPKRKILNDDYDPYLVFVNSHNGLGSIRVASVPIRIACSNALSFNLGAAKRSWSAMHAGNINYRLEEAKAALDLQERYIKQFDIVANHLANKPFTDVQFESIIDKMFPIDPTKDSERKIKNIQEIKSDLFTCLDAPDVKAYKGTAFAPVLAVTDWFDHSDPLKRTASFEEGRWEKIVSGNNITDGFFKEILAA